MGMWMMKYRFFSLVNVALIFFSSAGITFAQSKTEKLELAEEYFRRANFEKALDLYEELKGDPVTDRKILQHYLECLDKLKPGKGDAASKKFMKRYPEELIFFTTHYRRLSKNPQEKQNRLKFSESKLKPMFLTTADAVQEGLAFFEEAGDTVQASALLEDGIRRFGIGGFWEIRLNQLLQRRKNQDAAELIVSLVASSLTGPEEIQARIQEALASSDFSRALQVSFLRRIQSEPGNSIYPSFLAWIYMQKGDYEGALRQNLALDLLDRNGGIRSYQLGEFAMNAGEDKAAIRCFEAIMRDFPASQYRFLSQQKCMQLKEQVVKNTFPVNHGDVRLLIGEYRDLMNSQFLNVWELTMKVSELYGKYLNRPDSAILELERSMQTLRWPPSLLNRAKILLADMYVLKDEPWEASLLYGQVEKDEAESLTGYEAKLKNARLFYYKGEFELCSEILDVLKQSTSRDISNDAIELGLLIQDILAEDTTGFILSRFAEIDLLTWQGNYPESLSSIEKLLLTNSSAIVREKLHFRLFRNYEATRQFDKALIELDQIRREKASDLYADDALYFSGIIYAEQKKDKEKAMEFFLNLIKEIPGSVYISDARKRLRQLRGDFAN